MRRDILTCEVMISSHVKTSMISVISSLSVKLYLNSMVYHRNIFGSLSKVFGNLRKSSDIFENFLKFSEDVWECLGMRDRCVRSGTELAREIKLTDWSMTGNRSNRSSGVQTLRDICTRL